MVVETVGSGAPILKFAWFVRIYAIGLEFALGEVRTLS